MVSALLLLPLALQPVVRRAPSPVMGGLTGLPRIPTKALQLTKKFNPGGSYTEPIATLWRDLETLYGYEGVVTGGSRTQIDRSRLTKGGETGKFRGMRYNVDLRVETVYAMVKKDPDLLNPAVSNRFTFATSKSILVQKLGTESAAIDVMMADPSILREGNALEEQTASQIKTRAAQKQLMPWVAGASVAALAAAPMLEGISGSGLILGSL